MVQCCSVYMCKQIQKNKYHYNRTSVHVFPKNPEQKAEWIKFCRREPEWVPTPHSAICSKHFESKYIESSIGPTTIRRKIKKGAIPTIYEIDSDSEPTVDRARQPKRPRKPRKKIQFQVDVEVENLDEEYVEEIDISCVKSEPDYDIIEIHDDESNEPDIESEIHENKALIQEQIRAVDAISREIYENYEDVEQRDIATHDTSGQLPIKIETVESGSSAARICYEEDNEVDDAFSQEEQSCTYNLVKMEIEDSNESLDFTEDDKELLEEIRAVNEISFNICKGKLKATQTHAESTSYDDIPLQIIKKETVEEISENVEDIEDNLFCKKKINSPETTETPEEIILQTVPLRNIREEVIQEICKRVEDNNDNNSSKEKIFPEKAHRRDTLVEMTLQTVENRPKNTGIILDTDKVFSELNRLSRYISSSRNSTIDRIISTEARHIWKRPYFFKQICPQEMLLQKALDAWRLWVKSVVFRSSPVFYKCYICNKSWWHLSQLRDHIYNHQESDLKVSLEDFLYDCNLVVHLNTTTVRDIATEGACPKCFRDSSVHGHEKGVDTLYLCRGCGNRQLTCALLREHEFHCNAYILKYEGLDRKISIVCETCWNGFISKKEFDGHVLLAHSPRSDLPIYVPTQRKQTISKKSCNFCMRAFFTNREKNSHIVASKINSVYMCTVPKCRLPLDSMCNLVKHYVSHSNTFVVAYRCDLCMVKSVILVDDEAITEHFKASHSGVPERLRMSFSEFVYIPKMFLKPETPQLSENKIPVEISNSLPDDAEQNPKQLKTLFKISHIQSLSTPETVEENKTFVKEESFDDNTASDAELDSEPTIIQNETTLEEEEGGSGYENLLMSMFSVRDNNDIEIFNTNLMDSYKKARNDHIDNTKISNAKEKKGVKRKNNDASKSGTSNQIVNEESVENDDKHTSDDNENDFQFPDELLEIKQEIKVEAIDEDIMDDFITFDPGEDDNNSTASESLKDARDTKRKKVYKCKRCNFSGHHKSYANHRLKNHKHKSGYTCRQMSTECKCTKCNKSFKFLSKYGLHLSTVHDLPRNMCPACNTICENEFEFAKHLVHEFKYKNYVKANVMKLVEGQICENKHAYQCEICNENVVESQRFSHWEGHLTFDARAQNDNAGNDDSVSDSFRKNDDSVSDIDRKNDDDIEMEESVDAKQQLPKDRSLSPDMLKTVIDYLKNTIVQRKTNFECLVCSKIFYRRSCIKRHLIEHLLSDAYCAKRTEHSDFGIVLICQICGDTKSTRFYKSDTYRAHMRLHAKLPLYKCLHCGKCFSDSSNYTKHKKIHDPQVFTCNLCGKRFKKAPAYNKHLEMHEEFGTKSCSVCGIVFSELTLYKRHMRVKHVKHILSCHLCDVTFVNLKTKWDHMWQTHKIRNSRYDCTLCSAAYRRVSDLKRHMGTAHDMQVSISSLKPPNYDGITFQNLAELERKYRK